MRKTRVKKPQHLKEKTLSIDRLLGKEIKELSHSFGLSDRFKELESNKVADSTLSLLFDELGKVLKNDDFYRPGDANKENEKVKCLQNFLNALRLVFKSKDKKVNSTIFNRMAELCLVFHGQLEDLKNDFKEALTTGKFINSNTLIGLQSDTYPVIEYIPRKLLFLKQFHEIKNFWCDPDAYRNKIKELIQEEVKLTGKIELINRMEIKDNIEIKKLLESVYPVLSKKLAWTYATHASEDKERLVWGLITKTAFVKESEANKWVNNFSILFNFHPVKIVPKNNSFQILILSLVILRSKLSWLKKQEEKWQKLISQNETLNFPMLLFREVQLLALVNKRFHIQSQKDFKKLKS